MRKVWARVDWPLAGLTAVVIGGVIVASIGLVRYRNRDRAPTQTIQSAVQSLAAIPDSTIASIFDPSTFHTARNQFLDNVRGGRVSVDSIRSFYQTYCLWARDGAIDTADVHAFGAYLGLTRTGNE